MGLDRRIDDYAKKGDILPKHRHDFDHSMIVLKGSVIARTSAGSEIVEPLSEGGDIIIFRAGRDHEIEAREDKTVVLHDMPHGRT